MSVTVRHEPARILAAVRRTVRLGEIGEVWRPSLDQVWAFLRANPGLRTDGHNVFLYHHPARRDDPMEVNFGVEVVREFTPSGAVHPVRTPDGEVAVATHVGPYSQLARTHDQIQRWATTQARTFAGKSWEIYGDPTDDPASLEVTIAYLLR